MLSNGWYWSGRGHEAMAYPIVGWEVRCRWDRLSSGRWGMIMTVREEDPAPWMPGAITDPMSVRIRPIMDGKGSWDLPDPRVMEELSKRSGFDKVRQMIMCCRKHTDSTQVSK